MENLADRILQLNAALERGEDLTPEDVAAALREIAADTLELAGEIESDADADE